MKHALLAGFLVFGASQALAQSSDGPIEAPVVAQFKIQNARALGGGCPRGQVALAVSSSGGILAKGLLASHDLANETGDLSGISNCTIVVPTTIPEGYYPVGVNPVLNYTVQKSENSTYFVAAKVSLGSAEFPLRHHLYKAGVVTSSSLKVLSRFDSTPDFDVDAFCSSGRADQLLLKLAITSNATRDSIDDSVVSNVIGSENKELLLPIILKKCSL